MSTSVVSWGSIELLHNVVRTLAHLHEQGHAFPVVRYKAKVKLHGSNCAVQVTPDGVFAQSRSTMLTPDADYKGFAAWVQKHASYFAALPHGVVFGEWCGPGVEKGMAISQVAGKQFGVFSMQIGDRIVFEPAELRALVPATAAPSELHVLPWDGDDVVVIEYGNAPALEAVAAALSERVVIVEREDPWVKATFGISGVGEGLVFYPVDVDGAAPDTTPAGLAVLMFKAKGEKHRTVGAKQAVQVDATVAASVDELVALVVTDARLQQGLAAVCDGARDARLTGKFLAWVEADVKKEAVAELEAAGLTWAQVEKAVRTRARAWYLAP